MQLMSPHEPLLVKLGANGVLLVATGETTSAVVGGSGTSFYAIPVIAKTVQGRAVFVTAE